MKALLGLSHPNRNVITQSLEETLNLQDKSGILLEIRFSGVS
jgi:hypothetical protein